MVARIPPADVARYRQDLCSLYREEDAVVLIEDGVKQSKEARYMPGVKKLHQESRKLFLNLQYGVKAILGWDAMPERHDSTWCR